MDEKLIEFFDKKFQENRRHFEVVAEGLRTEIQGTRREFGVLTEGLRTEIQQVAEGHDLLNRKIDALQESMNTEFNEVKAIGADTASGNRASVIMNPYRERNPRL